MTRRSPLVGADLDLKTPCNSRTQG
jgi:hypothetical protein